ASMEIVQTRITKKRSLSPLSKARQLEAAPIPPSLANSPHLSSPHSIFRKKSVFKAPSCQDNEWLRDMVPLDRGHQSVAGSENGKETAHSPSASLSESSYIHILSPPSPILRPCSSDSCLSVSRRH
ncbi:hypothetical protein F5I97DRAFT_1801912, partial [Phlebopus sp. FC_14]